MKHIHFVCRGNVYRSRLAEAYAKSLLSGDEREYISSSGIEAKLDLHGAVSGVVPDLLEKDDARQYLKEHWQQTAQGHIDAADIVVFMSDTVYRGAREFLQVPEEKSIVWHIPDENGIYALIKAQVDGLLAPYITNT